MADIKQRQSDDYKYNFIKRSCDESFFRQNLPFDISPLIWIGEIILIVSNLKKSEVNETAFYITDLFLWNFEQAPNIKQSCLAHSNRQTILDNQSVHIFAVINIFVWSIYIIWALEQDMEKRIKAAC